MKIGLNFQNSFSASVSNNKAFGQSILRNKEDHIRLAKAEADSFERRNTTIPKDISGLGTEAMMDSINIRGDVLKEIASKKRKAAEGILNDALNGNICTTDSKLDYDPFKKVITETKYDGSSNLYTYDDENMVETIELNTGLKGEVAEEETVDFGIKGNVSNYHFTNDSQKNKSSKTQTNNSQENKSSETQTNDSQENKTSETQTNEKFTFVRGRLVKYEKKVFEKLLK